MTRNSDGATINQGAASRPDRGEPDRFDGIAGNAAERGGKMVPEREPGFLATEAERARSA